MVNLAGHDQHDTDAGHQNVRDGEHAAECRWRREVERLRRTEDESSALGSLRPHSVQIGVLTFGSSGVPDASQLQALSPPPAAPAPPQSPPGRPRCPAEWT